MAGETAVAENPTHEDAGLLSARTAELVPGEPSSNVAHDGCPAGAVDDMTGGTRDAVDPTHAPDEVTVLVGTEEGDVSSEGLPAEAADRVASDTVGADNPMLAGDGGTVVVGQRRTKSCCLVR